MNNKKENFIWYFNRMLHDYKKEKGLGKQLSAMYLLGLITGAFECEVLSAYDYDILKRKIK